jgi:hypothetical protein
MATKTQTKFKAAKERRQKKLAIGGAVLLVVILAVQVPRTMKMLGGAESTTAPAPTATAQPSPATPDQTVQPVATPVAAPDVLPDRNAEPEPGEGQLMSFELFEAKDPFAQQVTDQTAEAAAAGSGQGAASSVAPAPPPSGGSVSTGSTSSETETPRTTSSVSIAVNGTEETVRVSETFPAGDPTFVLVSSGSDFAKIAIAGGRLADGAGAVTLKRGRKLTLVNTADGARYELELR